MAKQTFSQELLFQKMLFFRTANFGLLTLFSQLHYLSFSKICADLHIPDMNKFKWVRKQLRTVMLWEFLLLYLSLVKVIPET